MEDRRPRPEDRGQLDLLTDPGLRDLAEDGEQRDLRKDPGVQDLARDRGAQESFRLGAALTGGLPSEIGLAVSSGRSAGFPAPRRKD